MRKLIIATALVAACNNNGGQGMGGPDMTAQGGNDMATSNNDMQMVMTMSIHDARQTMPKTPVTVVGVVTAVRSDGDPADTVDTKEWYIQDSSATLAGIPVFCDHGATTNPCPMSVQPPVIGDQVQVTGVVSPFRGRLELVPTAQIALKSNVALPKPIEVTADKVGQGSTAGWVGMLVHITGLTVDSVSPMALKAGNGCKPTISDAGVPSCTPCTLPMYSGFELQDSSMNAVLIENHFYGTSHIQSSPDCVAYDPTPMTPTVDIKVGSKFATVTGVFDQSISSPLSKTTPPGTVMTIQPTLDSDCAIQ